jgi:FkbM family methyltransferase
MFSIKYGLPNNNIDVTQIVYAKLLKDDIITIPRLDIERVCFFTDPVPGQLKTVYIVFADNSVIECDESKVVFIDLIKYKIYTDKDNVDTELVPFTPNVGLNEPVILNEQVILNEPVCNDNDVIVKLLNIQKQLRIDFGTFQDEFPEQIMAVKYLTGNEKILEIGGNIGRNSLIIAYILNQNNNANMVSLESDTHISAQLTHNKNLNNLNFFIENSALSKRKLIQREWDTMVYDNDDLPDGFNPVNIISLDELNAKYRIEFDTLILDCEGAFYYILMDMPEILENINLIIMENDYHDITHKQYIDDILKQKGFFVDYSKSGGWSRDCPCYNNFFEVWKK